MSANEKKRGWMSRIAIHRRHPPRPPCRHRRSICTHEKHRMAPTTAPAAWRACVPSLLTLLAGLVLALTTYQSYISIPATLAISQQCRMSRMWPSYELHTPDAPSGLDAKYRLYLYRENAPQRSAFSSPPASSSSRPAVFVHGNAGSFGQVRSVASWSWIQYQAQVKALGVENSEEIDWYTVDFNEDFSAFHAGILEAQSVYLNEVLAYLLARYPNATEVPILAHSMGGIVARLALFQDNHPRERAPVKTLVTLSTPHAVPPAPIEGGLQDIYNLINNNGQHVTTTSPSARGHQLQRNTLIVSLSGGLLDTQLPSEYALLPHTLANSSLQAFTTDLPTLWSSVDHLATMWCDQLRRKVLDGIRADGDVSARKRVWQRLLQQEGSKGISDADGQLDWQANSPLVELNATFGREYVVPLDTPSFRLLTSHPRRDLDVFVCRSTSSCSPIPHWQYALVPASPLTQTPLAWQRFPQAETECSNDGGGDATLRELRLDVAHLRAHHWSSIRVVGNARSGWYQAGWAGGDGDSAPSRTFHFPHVDSSLTHYTLTLQSRCAPNATAPLFAPMVHAYNAQSGDGRWYPSLSFDGDDGGKATLPLYLHGLSPYVDSPRGGITIDVYADASSSAACPSGSPIIEAVTITPDIRHSIGYLVSRYRVGLAVWPVVLWALVTVRGGSILHAVTARSTTAIVAGIIAFSIAQQAATPYFPDATRDALFGLTQQALVAFGPQYNDWILTSALALAAAALGYTLLALYSALLMIGTSTVSVIARRLPSLASFLRFDHGASSLDAAPPSRHPPQYKTSTIATIFVVCFLVKLSLLPYQFVYLALTAMQILNVIRSKVATTELAARTQQNTTVALHLVLLLPLRAPALVVFVRNFIAALQSSSSTMSHVEAGRRFTSRYSEDDSVLEILPVMLLVQILSTGRTVQAPRRGGARGGALSHFTTLTSASLVLVAVYGLVYGIRHPYRLYDLSLVTFSVIVAGHYACRWGLAEAQPALVARADTMAGDDGQTRMQSQRRRVRRSDENDDEDQEDSEMAMQRLLKDERIVAFSIPDELMSAGGSGAAADDTQDAAPPSRTPDATDGQPQSSPPGDDSKSNAAAAADPHPDTNPDAPASQPTPSSSSDLSALLALYLQRVDEYSRQQEALSRALSGAFFALSSDRMASGGWGANVRKDLAQAKLKAELQVEADGSDCRLIDVPLPYLPDEDSDGETKVADATVVGSTSIEKPSQSLRRRKGGNCVNDDGDEKDDSSSSTDEKATNAADTSPPRKRHPSALQQYSALPSANLRKAQQGFKQSLDIVAGLAPSQTAASNNLVWLRSELADLEAQIRTARRNEKGDGT